MLIPLRSMCFCLPLIAVMNVLWWGKLYKEGLGLHKILSVRIFAYYLNFKTKTWHFFLHIVCFCSFWIQIQMRGELEEVRWLVVFVSFCVFKQDNIMNLYILLKIRLKEEEHAIPFWGWSRRGMDPGWGGTMLIFT